MEHRIFTNKARSNFVGTIASQARVRVAQIEVRREAAPKIAFFSILLAQESAKGYLMMNGHSENARENT